MKILLPLILALTANCAVAETTCFGPVPPFDPARLNPASPESVAAAKSLTNEYFRILKSNSPNDAFEFWEKDKHGEDSSAYRRLNAQVLPEAQISFRQAFSTNNALGQEGEFVVAEYGMVTPEFHALHFLVWKINDDVWTMFTHRWIRRCSPGPKPVRLQPNKSLQLTIDPAANSAAAESSPASIAAERRR